VRVLLRTLLRFGRAGVTGWVVVLGVLFLGACRGGGIPRPPSPTPLPSPTRFPTKPLPVVSPSPLPFSSSGEAPATPTLSPLDVEMAFWAQGVPQPPDAQMMPVLPAGNHGLPGRLPSRRPGPGVAAGERLFRRGGAGAPPATRVSGGVVVQGEVNYRARGSWPRYAARIMRRTGPARQWPRIPPPRDAPPPRIPPPRDPGACPQS